MIVKVVKVIALLFLTYVSIISLVDIGDDLLAINKMQNSIREEIRANKDLNEKYEEFIETHR